MTHAHPQYGAAASNPCHALLLRSAALLMQVPPYELTEVGWGEFDIIVTVHFRVRIIMLLLKLSLLQADVG